MRKVAIYLVSAVVATTAAAPSAFARHRIHHAVVAPANPVIDQYGQFYATPVQVGPPTAGLGVGVVPGLDLAGGVAQPLLAPIGPIPGLDAAGTIVDGVTRPLLAPIS